MTDLEVNETVETVITYEVANGKVSKMIFTDEAGSRAVYTLTYAGNNLTKVVMRGVTLRRQCVFTTSSQYEINLDVAVVDLSQ